RASTAKMAKSRQHALDKIERIDKPAMFTKPPKIKLEYDIEPTKDIVRVIDCPLAVGEGAERKTLMKSLDMHVRRGEHVAIIGPNGAGKTSVLKMIQGLIPHDGGNIIWGNNIKISYFDQEHSNLDMRDTVIGAVDRKFPRMSELEIRKALGSVLLTGENVFKPISVISGGERAKLCFALMALNRGNVLILDEPTNHIDLNTKEVLEEALAEFDGTIILVSHDRYLLNKVATGIIEITPDGARFFEGNYDSYAATVTAEKQAAEQAEQALRQQAARLEYQENKQKQYRSKEQRAADAKRRSRIKELEQEIEQLEIDIFNLEQEISEPEVAANFEIMSEKCSKLEACRTSLDEKMDEWASLEQ
ncbi:MAG: ATP-binding cassette domain-containing protein, partial [Oscillospiraceae bacterium]